MVRFFSQRPATGCGRASAKRSAASHLQTDPQYATGRDRLANRDALNADIAALTVGRTSAEWFDLFSEAGIPCGPVYSMDKVFEDRQVCELGMVMDGEQEDVGALRLVAQPNNIEGHAKTVRLPPARLGEHTDEILTGLGFAPAEIAALKTRAVV